MHASPAFMFSIKVVCNIFAFIQCLNKSLLEIWESIFIVHLLFFFITWAIRYLLCLFLYSAQKKIYSSSRERWREGDTNDKNERLFFTPSFSLDRKCVCWSHVHTFVHTWTVYIYCSLSLSLAFFLFFL